METTVPSKKEERISRILEAVNDSQLSTIKTVVTGVINIIRNPRSTAHDLKALVEIDPPLTAKILRVANSSYYAPQSKIDEIDKAIIWIGFDRLKELVIRQKTCSLFENKDSIEGYRRTELWAYCVAAAHFGKMIYRREFSERGENVYSAGLLHKIGMIAEEQFLRMAFTRILKIAHQQEQHLPDIESKIFGFSHAELGGRIIQKWGLPEEFVAAVTYHTNPYEAPEEYFKISATLFVSAMACHFSELGYAEATPFNEEIYGRCLDDLNISQESLNIIIDEGRHEIAEMLEHGVL